MGRRWAKYFFFLATGLAIFYFIEWFFFQFRMKFPLKTNKVTMEDMNTALGATTEEEKTKTLLLVYTVFLEPKSGYKIVVVADLKTNFNSQQRNVSQAISN